MDIYQHYKGGFYEFLTVSKHTETGETFVIYKDKDLNVWARPYDMFFSTVEYKGETVPRFKFVGFKN